METIHSRNDKDYVRRRFLVGLLAILKREWFIRTWIVQEFVLNRAEPLIACGQEKMVLWADFLAAYQIAFPFGTDDMPRLQADHQRAISPLLLQFMARHNTIAMLRALRNGTHKPREHSNSDGSDSSDGLAKYNLRHILLATRQFLAADPRDKIYGVLGLTFRDSRKHITPTYKTSIARVFREATMGLLRNERTTEAYAYLPVGRRRRFGEWFPSWIPDFAVSIEQALVVRASHVQNTNNMKQHRVDDDHIQLLDGGDKLHVRGFLLDTVEHIVNAPPETPPTNPIRTVSQVVTAWAVYLYKFYNTPVPPLIAAFSSLVGMIQTRARLLGLFQALGQIYKWPAWRQGRARLQEPAWKMFLLSEANNDKYKDEAACQKKFDTFGALGRLLLRDERPHAWIINPVRLAAFFHNLNLTDPIESGIMTTFVEGRYFFGCENGWYGVGEGVVQVGDKLALLFPDANVPFILREKDGCYEMVGLAYVPENARNAAATSSDANVQPLVLV